MKPKQIIIIAGVIIGIVVVGLIFLKVFQPASRSVDKINPDFTLSSTTLVSEFENDEKMANSLYLDKIIEVSGTISNISDDGSVVVVTLKEPESLSGVLCSFDKNFISMEKMSLGTKVTIKGICTGYLLDVVLTKCALVE